MGCSDAFHCVCSERFSCYSGRETSYDKSCCLLDSTSAALSEPPAEDTFY